MMNRVIAAVLILLQSASVLGLQLRCAGMTTLVSSRPLRPTLLRTRSAMVMDSSFNDACQLVIPAATQFSKVQMEHGTQTMFISLSISDDNFAQAVLEQGATAFFYGLTTQVVTFIFGNILAGLAFKALLDFISNGSKASGQKDEKNAEWKVRDQSAAAAAAVSSQNTQSTARGITWDQWMKLLLCVFIDAVGDSSFLVPGVGEIEDIAWAPISAFLVRKIFQSDVVGNIEFVKEILPFTDAIPLASSLWVLETLLPDNGLNKLLGLKKDRKEDK